MNYHPIFDLSSLKISEEILLSVVRFAPMTGIPPKCASFSWPPHYALKLACGGAEIFLFHCFYSEENFY